MTKKYSGETVILPDGVQGISDGACEEFCLFAFHDGKIDKFRIEGKMRLGRMTDNNVPDIAVQNMFLSRSHGYFSVEGHAVTYTAEKTTNGISLNGGVIQPGTTVILSDGDELTIPAAGKVSDKSDFVLKCAFSTSKISLWDSMIKVQLDELTGLPGRRLFTDSLGDLPKSGGDDWFFILDIDKFKQINDIYGHSAGDATLRTLAEELRKPEHRIRLSARWGGDEFVGVISGSKDDITHTISGFADSLSSTRINDRFPILISVGICMIPKLFHIDQLPQTVEKADKALYSAKRSEAEKICFYE